MRIAMVSEHASPLAVLGGADAGGQNVHVAELARGLADLGSEVVVHTRRDDPGLPRRVPFGPGVVVDHVDAGPPRPLPKDALLPHMRAFARDLRRVWSVERPDVVHSHFWMSGRAALDAGRRLGIPVAHTFHALGIEKRSQQGTRDTSPRQRIGIEANIARRADLVIATTATERNTLIAMGASPDRVSVVPCGVDLQHFHPLQHAATRHDRARVLVVSRLVERKGIGNVVEALAALPGVELVIAGGPAPSMLARDAEARRFQALASRHGVDERVHLLGGVQRKLVPQLFRSADVVACCPWYEPFGMVAVEAMACGVPVVATAVGGLAETVQPGLTGLLVPPREPARIAAALETLLSSPQLREVMGTRAMERARRYAWPQVAAETFGHLVGLTTRTQGAAVPERRPA